MAEGKNGKKRGVFSIPSVEEIKRAQEITARGKPTIFKTAAPAQKKETTNEIAAPAHKPHPLPQSPTPAVTERSRGLRQRGGAVDPKEHTGVGGGGGTRGGAVPTPSREHSNCTTDTTTDITVKGNRAMATGELPSIPVMGKLGASTSREEGREMEGGGVGAMTCAVETRDSPTYQNHPHAIIANPVQVKNPVLKHFRNVPWELGDIVPDFVLGRTTCALFLSVRYHSLHPDYIHNRLKQLGRQYVLRILLVLADMSECHKILHELAKIAILADLTLIVAWTYEEAGRYLETYKVYENKPPDSLMERVESDFTSRATESLTTVKKVNKTDAATLLNTFKSMEGIIRASKEELTLCPGLGQQKAQRLHQLFHEPFICSKKPKLNQY